MNENEKPIELRFQEMMDGFARLINEAEVPAIMVEGGLRDLLAQVHQIAVQQYNQAKQAYEEKQKKKA